MAALFPGVMVMSELLNTKFLHKLFFPIIVLLSLVLAITVYATGDYVTDIKAGTPVNHATANSSEPETTRQQATSNQALLQQIETLQQDIAERKEQISTHQQRIEQSAQNSEEAIGARAQRIALDNSEREDPEQRFADGFPVDPALHQQLSDLLLTHEHLRGNGFELKECRQNGCRISIGGGRQGQPGDLPISRMMRLHRAMLEFQSQLPGEQPRVNTHLQVTPDGTTELLVLW